MRVSAVVVEAFGAPEVLRLSAKELPPLLPQQVRVKLEAAGVNPSDTYLRQGPLGPYGAVPQLLPRPDSRLFSLVAGGAALRGSRDRHSMAEPPPAPADGAVPEEDMTPAVPRKRRTRASEARPEDLKIILCGDSAVGKSKMVERFLLAAQWNKRTPSFKAFRGASRLASCELRMKTIHGRSLPTP